MKLSSHPSGQAKGRLRSSESGQAIVEYVLILVVVVTVMGALGRGLRTSVRSVWVALAKEIAAPCPKCDPPASMR